MPLQLSSGAYGLRQPSTSNKTVLLMKLTDSALRMIESYQDNSGGVRRHPTIQFQGNQGIIQIPTIGGGDGDPELQAFTFQVSNLTQSAGVDCLQQIRTGQTGRVECLGSIQQKITVNATDDSYNMTRKRMTLAKEEEQKTSTKVIKQPSSSKIGKLFKKKTGKGRIVDKHNASSVGRLSPDARAPTPPLSRLTPTLLSNRSSSPLTTGNKDTASSPPGVPGSGRNKTKPMISISSSSSSIMPPAPVQQVVNGAPNMAVAARPLWDRVAHLLAVRPYKYPDLVKRLTRDKAPDKGRLQTILQQVASTRNAGGGSTEFCLLRSCHNSLDTEWPGYTDQDRSTVKKRLAEGNGPQENRKRGYAASLSPSNSKNTPDSAEVDQYSNPTIKKQRVSHYKKPSPGRPAAPVSTSRPASPMETEKVRAPSPVVPSGISFGTTKLSARDTWSTGRSRDQARPPETRGRDTREIQNENNVAVERVANPNSHSPEKTSKKDRNHKSVSQNMKSEEEDYLLKYIQISSVEQRDRYKSDFYAEYQEYLCHHSNVAAVSERFAKLQRKLNEHKKGSEEYNAISKQVIQEYKKTKKNGAYRQERTRMQFLHRKLQHIKLLVNDFDRHKLANRPENEPGICMQAKTATPVA